MNKQIITVTSFILLFANCDFSKTKRILIGTWAIENIDYKYNPQYFGANLLIFEESGECILPVAIERDYSEKDGRWELIKKGSYYGIVINSENVFFQGNFKIESLELVKKRGGHFYYLVISNHLSTITCNRPLF